MKKVLLTGGAGFIAGHIAKKYLKEKLKVFIVDKKPKSKLRNDLKGKVIYFQEDLRKNNIEKIIQKIKPDVVNHHAASISVSQSSKNPLLYAQNNVLATIKLLQLSEKYRVKQFIFASSVAVYGDTKSFPTKETDPTNPNSFYALNKFSCEKYLNLFQEKFKTTIFRYANVYGPFQDSKGEGGVISIFAYNLSYDKQSYIYGSGDQTRDFIYVEDIANANFLATKKQISGLFNLSNNNETSINNLYFLIQKITKSSTKPIYKPKRIGDIKKSLLDNSKAKKLLKWKPEYVLEKGLSQTLRYFSYNDQLQ